MPYEQVVRIASVHAEQFVSMLTTTQLVVIGVFLAFVALMALVALTVVPMVVAVVIAFLVEKWVIDRKPENRDDGVIYPDEDSNEWSE